MEMDVCIEQLLTVELDSVRHADVAHVPALASRTDRLHHRFLGADALQHRVGADSVGQLLDAGHSLVTALCDDVGRAELARQFLSCLVTAHGDDPLSTHLLRGEHTKKPDGTVTDDRDCHPRFSVGCGGGEPAGAHTGGYRQKTRY